MTKKEKLQEKTIELMAIMLKQRAYLEGVPVEDIIKYYREMAEKDLSRGGFLTDNQKRRLKEKIDALKAVTGHNYEHLTYNANTKNTALGFADFQGIYRIDMFAPGFLSFMDVFESGKVYFIEDLLNESHISD